MASTNEDHLQDQLKDRYRDYLLDILYDSDGILLIEKILYLDPTGQKDDEFKDSRGGE